jgi:hypothetical protein
MDIPPKAIKIPMPFFSEIEKSTIKFRGKHKSPQMAKTILSKKSNIGGTIIQYPISNYTTEPL